MSAARSSPPPRVARAALAVAALCAVGIFHVWSHTRVTTAGYRLGELQRQGQALRAERDRLEVEVATLRAPGRLEAFARERLGMAPPAAGAVVRAPEVPGAPGVARAAPAALGRRPAEVVSRAGPLASPVASPVAVNDHRPPHAAN